MDEASGGHVILYDDGERTVETLKPLMYRILQDSSSSCANAAPIAAGKAVLQEVRLADTQHSNMGHRQAKPQQVAWPIAWRGETALSRKTTKRKPAAAPKADDQYVLDLKSKGFAKSCPSCGMLYNQGHASDEATHQIFHRQFEQRIRFPGWKDERVLQRLDEDERGARIVSVNSGDKSAHLLKLGQLKQTMDAEMGSVGTGDSPNLSRHSDDRAFLFISDQGIAVGCAIVQRVPTAFQVATRGAAGSQAGGDQSEDDSEVTVLYNIREPHPCTLGVRQMWVHKQHRRRNIMTRLLDAARSNFNFGQTIPCSKIAFTQTTVDGRKFASKYCDTSSFLVYETMQGI